MFIQKEKDNLIYLQFEQMQQFGFQVIFTTRIGGFSQKPYDTLNLGLHTAEQDKTVIKNRKKLYGVLDYKSEDIVYGEQIHSNNIKVVTPDDKGKGVWDHKKAVQNMDGLIATDSKIILGGHFADCVPIYILDKKKGSFSLVHAGWQGTYKKILAKAINFFKDGFDSSLENLIVILGPSISGQNYEVGSDLIDKFKEKFDFPSSYFTKINNNFFLDIKEVNKMIALQKGIKKENIFISNLCTFNNEKLFYSYRRDQGKTGRMAAFISRI